MNKLDAKAKIVRSILPRPKNTNPKPEFSCRREWAEYAVRVAKGHGGSVQVNLYSWARGQVRLLRACRNAVRAGLMVEHKDTKAARRQFSLR